MGYCSVSDVRLLTDITTDDIGDTDLLSLINLATQMIIEDLTISREDELLDGNIDGSNTTFSTNYYPIADIDGDKSVGPGDITVYTWTDSEDPATKSTVPISTIYPREGIIVLQSAPSKDIDQVTADYSYLFEADLNWEMLKLACAYLTAFLFYVKMYTAVPIQVARGPIRFRFPVKPYSEYLDKYYQVLRLVKKKEHIKGKAGVMEIPERFL